MQSFNDMLTRNKIHLMRWKARLARFCVGIYKAVYSNINSRQVFPGIESLKKLERQFAIFVASSDVPDCATEHHTYI